MRIAILSWESLHSIAVGGVAAHTSELAEALAARGHQMHFFTRRMPGQNAHDLIDGVHYHRCFYQGHRDFVEDMNNMCRAFVDRLFEVEDLMGRFDIVHAHDWLAANAMIWSKQGRKHNTILTIHSTEYDRCGNAFYGGTCARIRDQERAGTYWADRVIAVSEATKKEIMWMYEVPEQKVSVVGNGVNWKRFDDIDVDPGKVKAGYGIGPMDPTVLFCGRLAWQKGPDILVEAIPQVLRNYPNSKFVFVGDGDMRGSLEGRARHLGVAHAVRFLGYRNGQELIKLFKSCETVCVPSRSEPFGIVVLEAWSASKPAIVSENGGLKDLITHEVNGIKIFPRPDSVLWGINRVFSNFDWSREIGKNGRLFLENNFGWDQITSEVLEVYKQVAPELQPQPQPQPQPLPVPIVESSDPAAFLGKQDAGENAEDKSSSLVTAKLSGDGSEDGYAGVELEAKIMLPASQNDTTSVVLETLSENQLNHSFAFKQKERYLKIKGDWGEVTRALSACRKRLMQGGNGSSLSAELSVG